MRITIFILKICFMCICDLNKWIGVSDIRSQWCKKKSTLIFFPQGNPEFCWVFLIHRFEWNCIYFFLQNDVNFSKFVQIFFISHVKQFCKAVQIFTTSTVHLPAISMCDLELDFRTIKKEIYYRIHRWIFFRIHMGICDWHLK